MWFFVRPKNEIVSFFTLRESLFAVNQSVSLDNSLFNLFSRCSQLLSEAIKLVSSAKSINLRILEQLCISFIDIINKSGPRMDPWGTPQVIDW